MKKKILVATSYAAVAALAIGGTMAYFTATDEAVNVMTIGKGIDIDIVEQQRSEDGTELVNFKNGSETLMPIDDSAQGTKDDWGMPTAENYVDKIVSVDNNGTTDAYVRVFVAVPLALSGGDDASAAVVHVNWANRFDPTGKGQYNSGAWDNGPWDEMWGVKPETSTMTIDGQEYYVECFTMQEPLKGGESTLPVISGAYLDSRVDYDADKDVYTLNGAEIDYDFSQGVVIPVYAQAIQVDGFATAAEAFKAAGFPENPWENSNVVIDDKDVIKHAEKYVAYEIVDGEPIEGLVVADSTDNLNLRALYNGGNYVTQDLVISDSYLAGQYAMNVYGKDGANLIVTDTALYGWTSFTGFGEATFTGCTFGEGPATAGLSYNYIRPYDDTTFTNCEFKGSTFDVADGATVTFVNCTYNGKALTQEMIEDIIDETTPASSFTVQ